MGSKSSSKSSSSSNFNTGGMGGGTAVKGAAQQGSMMNGAAQHQQNLMGSILGTAMPAFGELIKGGMQQMNSNPMYQAMGAMMGMPVQMDSPQWIDDFIQKHTPTEPTGPAPTVQPDTGWGGVKTDAQAIQWALENGDISEQDAKWLLKWQGEASDGNNWVDGSGGTKDWDYMSSGLTNQNKGIVDRFYNSVSGNWGGAQPQQQQQPQQQAAAGRRSLFGGVGF